ADLSRDFFAHPLSCLLEAVLQFVVGLLRASLCTVPSGLGSVLDVLKLFVQLPRLLAQRLKLWCGFGLGGITGFFNFGCELIQVPIDSGQLALHFSVKSAFCAKV